MYRMHKKTGPVKDPSLEPAECFASETKYWFWVLGVLVFGAVFYAIIASGSSQEIVYSSTVESFPHGGQLQTIAATKCPYCPGILDAQGRCNVRPCPIYSPNWGKPTNSAGIPVKKVLIKELALEVGASQGKGTVIVQSVYIGGNADKGGLKAGDRIVRFNGRKVDSVADFQSVVTRAKPESNVKVKVIRDGEKVKATVMVGEGEMEGATLPSTTNAW